MIEFPNSICNWVPVAENKVLGIMPVEAVGTKLPPSMNLY